MSKKIVIMASEEGREALRACGVLPPSAFKKFDAVDDHDSALAAPMEEPANDADADKSRRVRQASSLGFYVWPHEPDYQCASSGFGDFPLLSMLGMKEPKNNAEYLERKITYTKLLNSTILHVILMDECDLGGKMQKPELFLTAPIVKWCDMFQSELRREYSEEQTKGIEHAFILIARNPSGFTLDAADVESFCKRLDTPEDRVSPDDAKIHTCFFLDSKIEIETGHDLFPSAFVWPQMVGRLLLRILIELAACPENPFGSFKGGIRLWKASELVIDFNPQHVHKLMSDGINKFIKALREGETVADTELSLRPWCPSVDRALGALPNRKHRDKAWNEFCPKECIDETYDDEQWKRLSGALRQNVETGGTHNMDDRSGDVDNERRHLANEIHRSMPAADTVREAVSDWISKTSGDVQSYFTKKDNGGVSEYWGKVVGQCLRRARCKDLLDGMAADYDLAKGHYVKGKYCLGAAGAIALCAGLVFSRFVAAMGGGVFLALLLCAGTVAGGLSVMFLAQRLHNMSGKKARSQMIHLCEIADDSVLKRDEWAHDQIRKAVEIRARMLQLAKMSHFQALISRLQTMINDELTAPSSEVVIEDDLPELTEDDNLSQTLKNQYDLFFRNTMYRIGFDDNAEEAVSTVRDGFSRDSEWVRTKWSALCAEHDPRSAANFPARYFVPFLKRTLNDFRNKYRPVVWRLLAERSISEMTDRLTASASSRTDELEIRNWIRAFALDDACYSAHVDLENKKSSAAMAGSSSELASDSDTETELFYAPIFEDDRWSDLKDRLWCGLDGVRDHESPILMGRTPHFAFIFAQAKVGFSVKDRKLVLCDAGTGKEDDND